MHTRIERFCKKADSCLQKGNLEEAGIFYSRVLAIDPEHEESFTNLTFVIYDLHPRKALKILLGLQKNTAKHLNIQIKLGDLFQHLGYSKKAIQVFLNIKDKDPENAETYFKLGILHIQKGEQQAAEFYLEKAFLLNPFERKIFDNYFDQLYILGKEDSIAEASSKLMQLYENKSDTFILLGKAYKRIYKLEEAVLYFKKALEYSPENEAILYQLGSTLLLGNDYLEAASVFKKVLQVNPQFSQARSCYKYALNALISENEKKQ